MAAGRPTSANKGRWRALRHRRHEYRDARAPMCSVNRATNRAMNAIVMGSRSQTSVPPYGDQW
jgi:hypothetical protein